MPDTQEQTEENPIIFSGWSIRRILAGEKSQTRRIMKPQPKEVDPPTRQTWTLERKWLRWKKLKQTSGALTERCPYGQPGDVLYVREAFRFDKAFDEYSPADLVRSEEHPTLGRGDVQYEATPDEGPLSEETVGRKRPSIHMPRELCRLQLRVEDVRVERLQEIGEDDAMAEGVESVTRRSTSVHGGTITSASVAFKELWKEIHGDDAWEENPYVWVVEFSKINAE
jgi:hypothetical protein